ncbi:hypothetical protein ONZ45_g8476 [Pleurotus djamor]|nr:hypothetical protein ONZ45_g8476 [Pleurotus djamor]
MARSKNTSRIPRARWLTNDPNYEARIQSAIDGTLSKKYKSLKAASIQENVNYSTLKDRFSGKHRSSKEFHQSRQKLTPAQEETLATWTAQKADSGEPISQADLRQLAVVVSCRPVGKHWVRRYIKRQPRFVLGKSNNLDPKRAKNFNRSNVNEFISDWRGVVEVRGIPPGQIWNMDEKGLQMGAGRSNSPLKFIFNKGSKTRYKISSDNLELVTVLECVSAAGKTCPPSFVLSEGPTPSLQEVANGLIGGVAVTQTGWTNGEIARKWLRDVFFPHAMSQRVDVTKPIVLVMDRHESHDNLDFVGLVYEISEEKGCDLLISGLPSKTTHKLQPLDVGVLNHVQRLWRHKVEERRMKGIKINRYTVIPAYMECRAQVLEEWIRSAWAKTGLWPINPDIFTDEDFAPSQASSILAHVPPSFPDDVPTSPPAIPSDAEDDEISDVEMDGEESEEPGTRDGVDNEVDTEREEACFGRLSDWDDEGSDFEMEWGTHSEASEPEPEEDIDGPETSTVGLIEPTTPSPASRATRIRLASEHLSSEPTTPSPASRATRILLASSHLSSASPSPNGSPPPLRSPRSVQHRSQRQLEEDLLAIQLEGDRVQLDNLKKQKERGSKKIRGEWLTLPENKAAFEAQLAERAHQEAVAAQKEADKAAEEAARQERISIDATSKVFLKPLTSYRKKEDLLVLATALGLSTDGTIPELSNRIKDHLEANSAQLKDNDRFAGLFTAGRRRTQIDST